MKYRLYSTSLLVLLSILVSACGGLIATPTPTPTRIPPTETPLPPTETPLPPTPTESPTATPSQPSVTRIAIDGQPDDWAGRSFVVAEPVGMSEQGFLDLTKGSSFLNQDAFYLLLEVADPKASFVQFDLVFQAGAQRLLISWAPGQLAGSLADTTGEFKTLGKTVHSQFAFAPALEARIDRRDLGSPESLSLMEVKVMAGKCCENPAWHAADQWQPVSTPEVYEVDPLRLTSDKAEYRLARYFQLPDGYVAKRLFAPPLPDLVGITRSQGDVVFIQQGGLSSGLSILDPEVGLTARILDLPQDGVSHLVGGPRNSAFIGVNGEIWQVQPHGEYTVWGRSPDGQPRYYTSNGKLLGVSNDGTRLLELLPDGTSREISSGFKQIYDVVASNTGSIFVSDWETGDITRINSNGTQRVLVSKVLVRDPLDLEIGQDGGLYLNSTVTGFVKIDIATGKFSTLDWALTSCTLHPADFAFYGERKVLFIDPTWSQVTWADMKLHKNGLLISNRGANTGAADISPDGALYVGAWGCGKDLPAQVVRIGEDGSRTVYLDGFSGEIRDIAFAPSGELFIVTFDQARGTRLYYSIPGGDVALLIPLNRQFNITSIDVDPARGNLLAVEHGGSSILEFTSSGLLSEYPVQLPKPVFDFYIAVTPGGSVYAYASEAERQQTGPVVERWILRLDLQAGKSEIIAQSDHVGCCGMGNLNAGLDGALWWIIDPEFRLYKLVSGEQPLLFAQNLPLDPAAAVANGQGEVYFTSPSGIYKIYREP